MDIFSFKIDTSIVRKPQLISNKMKKPQLSWVKYQFYENYFEYIKRWIHQAMNTSSNKYIKQWIHQAMNTSSDEFMAFRID